MLRAFVQIGQVIGKKPFETLGAIGTMPFLKHSKRNEDHLGMIPKAFIAIILIRKGTQHPQSPFCFLLAGGFKVRKAAW
jgi:hypothetical protein